MLICLLAHSLPSFLEHMGFVRAKLLPDWISSISAPCLTHSRCSLSCCSVTKSHPTLYDLFMDCILPVFPALHHLPEFAQTHVHWISDAIQPSHPLLLPSPLTLNLSCIRLFSNELALHIRWPKYWSFSFSINPSNEYSGLISSRIDWLDLLAVQGTLKSLLQHHISLNIHFIK